MLLDMMGRYRMFGGKEGVRYAGLREGSGCRCRWREKLMSDCVDLVLSEDE